MSNRVDGGKNAVENQDSSAMLDHQDARPESATAFTPLPDPPPLIPEPQLAQGDFTTSRVLFGGGVAIFHIATARVVLCYHTVHRYWFLPKGRKDAGEDALGAAEREGYEESGYRNRLLPVPLCHIQPKPYNTTEASSPFSTEPIMVSVRPFHQNKKLYITQWRIAETVPPDVEAKLHDTMLAQATSRNPTPYQYPPMYPETLTLQERVALDLVEDGLYEPVRHANTGVNDEEANYESRLVPVAEAVALLGNLRAREDWVVHQGWQAICARFKMEADTRTKTAL